jgi:TolB-like protein/DNA-binding winged helix-turn-helix (wHTH) protein/Tfp pilus assembly protein PilF
MPTGNSDGAVQIGEWIVNPSLDTISKGTETQKLEPRTMRLLMCLANSGGEVVSVDRLLTEVWTGVVVGSASVYQSVSQLRKLLGDVDPNPTYIVNIPRKGYRLIAPLRRIEAASASSGIAAVSETPAAETSAAKTPIVVSQPPARKRKTPLIVTAAVLIALLATGVLLWKKQAPGRLVGAVNSIVVLPFVDMTAEKTDQSFCDGLTEELSNWLAQIPTLHVVARTSAFAFRGQGEDVRKIGKALDTNHVLEGSMRRSGDHMRVTVQLIDARSGYHLWSEDFDRPIADAIKMQEDISRSVAKTLQVRLDSASERQLAERRTSDPEAYQLYLLARYYQQQTTPKSTDRAIELLRQVLVADPKFAPAYVLLSRALLNQRQFRDLPIADVATEVEPLISAALRIDDRSSGAYAVRGSLRAEQSRQKEALADLQTAISLNPSDMLAIASIGRIRLLNGQPREALKSYDRAAALDPLNPALQVQRCTALEDLAQYEAAATACERARILQPGGASAADRLTWLAESRGHIEEALRWNSESIKAEPADDFDLYWNRATLFLSVGLASPARAAVDLGLGATKDDIGTHAALVRVVYCEAGKDALKAYLSSVHLDQLPYAVTLQEAAYARLLLDDAAAAKGLIERALLAPDRFPGFAEIPWFARGEGAVGVYRVDLAVAYLALSDRPAAAKELDIVLAMVDEMIAAGVERYATYALRAKIYALQGKSDDAMRDLNRAVKLGWRQAWWAMHEPYLASLRTRSDFQALMAQVSRSNDQLIKKLRTEPSGHFSKPDRTQDLVSPCSDSG